MVLTYVETGNVDAGVVYLTDARQSGKVAILVEAPADSHDQSSTRAIVKAPGSPPPPVSISISSNLPKLPGFSQSGVLRY